MKVEGKSIEDLAEEFQNDFQIAKVDKILEEQQREKYRHIQETLKAMEEDFQDAKHCEVDNFLLAYMIKSFKKKYSWLSQKNEEKI